MALIQDIINKHVKLVPFWRSDKPKKPGWYPASKQNDVKVWRFYDGRYWSMLVYPSDTSRQVNDRVRLRALGQDRIQWMDWEPKSKTAKAAVKYRDKFLRYEAEKTVKSISKGALTWPTK